MDQIKDKKYFTNMDIRWGYNNIRIHEGDEWKVAFKTKFGLFEPLVMMQFTGYVSKYDGQHFCY
jgi:hypothetical protein